MVFPELWVVVLAIGAALRLTRLITRDTITRPLRNWVVNRYGPETMPDEFVRCPWCVGFWISLLVAAAALIPPIAHSGAFLLLAAALTLSYLVGLAANWLD